ncbi:glycosyltransferase [Porticoccaceae bacterium]|nr:glycosyltransferase [Porticoccaceae bacterium]
MFTKMSVKSVNFLINDFRLVGGAERLIVDLASGLDDLGWPVKLFTLGEDMARLENHSKELNCVKLSFKSLRSLFKSDVLHISLFPCLYIVSFLSIFLKRKGQKLIYHEHNTVNNRRKYKVFRIVDSIVYSRFDSIICISQATKDNLDSWLLFGSQRTSVIHNFSCVPLARNLSSFKKRAVRIGMAGAVSPQKDQQFLIDFIRQGPETNYELSLIGGNVESSFDVSGANIKVWDGPEKILDFYDYIDVYVHAANWEGFGLVAIEACRRGKPVLLPRIPGISEVALDDSYLYESGNSTDFREKLERINKNLSDANCHSKRVADKFSITFFIEKYEALIKV